MQKVIIFDYDDTLVKAKESHLNILSSIYGDKFHPHEGELARKLPMPTHGIYHFLAVKNCETGTFEDFTQKFNAHNPDDTDLIDWVPAVMAKLKLEGYDAVICSGNDLHKIEANLNRHHLRHYFKYIIVTNADFSKEQSDVSEILSKKYKVKQLQCVVISNSSSDQRMANNSGINYLDIAQFTDLSPDQIFSAIISATSVVVPQPKNSKVQDSLIQFQYQSLRQELLNLQESEEKSYATTILAFGAIYSALLTIIFTKDVSVFPGLAFLFSSLYALFSKSKYVSNGLRVANISAFIAVKYKSFLPLHYNWERKLSDFSNDRRVKEKVKLSNVIKTTLVYDLIFYISLVTATVVSTIFWLRNFVPYAYKYYHFGKPLLPPVELLHHLYIHAKAYFTIADLSLVSVAVIWCIKQNRKFDNERVDIKFSTRGNLLRELWNQIN